METYLELGRWVPLATYCRYCRCLSFSAAPLGPPPASGPPDGPDLSATESYLPAYLATAPSKHKLHHHFKRERVHISRPEAQLLISPCRLVFPFALN